VSDNEFFGGRRRRRAGAAFSPYSLFASGEQGVWYDPSDLTPEKVSWRRNLLTYSQDFENAAWTKSNASLLSNLALYSQDFDNAAWGKSTASVTANTSVAPDGTTTGDTVTSSGATGYVYPANTGLFAAAGGATYTYSVYAKAGTATSITLLVAATATYSGTFNLSTGVSSTGTANTTVSMVDAGNGWWRCIITCASVANTAYTELQIGRVASTLTFLVWGAQLVVGSTAQTYTRSLATAAPVMFSDPLGGTMADKLVENTAAASHTVFRSTTISAGADFTYTVYVKAAERGFCQVRYENSGATKFWAANVNLSDGTFTTQAFGSPTGTSASVTAVGSGWYRVTLGVTADTTTFVTAVFTQAVQGTNSYTGDGVSGVLVYGAQLEQASTASAYQRITDFNSDFLAAFPTHALYQDSTFATPVTALGQSVGGVIDKRLGGLAAVGPELVTNGDFSSATGWTFTGSTPGWSVVGGAAECLSTAAGNRWIVQTAVPIVVGRTYVVTLDAVIAAGSVTPDFGNSLYIGTSGKKQWLVTATTTQFQIMGTNAFIGTVDNVSCKLVPGNHAIQATSASRPTLQARANLLTYSEQFDNAAWGKTNGAVTANGAVAPDGTTTADAFIENTAAGNHYIGQSPTVLAGSHTFSVYYKLASGTRNIALYHAGVNQGRQFDASGNSSAGAFNAPAAFAVTAVGSGWYRASITVSLTASSSEFRLWYSDASNNLSYTGDGTSGYYLWGAQVDAASTASTYQRVVTATDYADVGLPRNLTFDGVDDSLATAGNVDFATWTVGTRRNLLTVPTMFDDAAWTKTRSSVTANTTTAPDGTTTADKLVEDTTASATHPISVSYTTAASAYTLSVYVKAAGRSWVQLSLLSTTNAFGNFNVSNGTLGTIGAAATAGIEDAGNGWYRCRITATTAAGANTVAFYPASADNTVSYTGDGTSGLFLWGAQLEVGSTATAFQDVGTDKVTLFSGVFKGTDTGTQEIVEFGNRGITQAGSFSFDIPASAAYRATLEGTLQTSFSPATFAAPITNVVSLLFDIGAAARATEVIPRINGVVNQTNPTGSADAGTGNFGSYVLFVGRRNNATLPFNGRLFQLVIRGAATDSVTVGNAERWVGQLTGVAL